MGLLGLKRKRSPEEQKEYEKKVFETTRDMTVAITEKVFRFTHIDKGIQRLQLITERYPRVTVALMGGTMTAILLYFIALGNRPSPDSTDPLALDSVAGRVMGFSSGYGEVFKTNTPKDFVEQVVREMKIDTVRYRTDCLYRIETNREFIIRYGKFDESVIRPPEKVDSVMLTTK